MKPALTIIIPCYNSQKTLEETLISVFNQEYKDWEALIINDGSPDNLEEIALKWLKKDSRFKYFKKENGGLGSARNYGLNKSTGKYILPLDSDNKIHPNFATNALELFKNNNGIGVVYGNAMYFGDKVGKWEVGMFDKFKMLHHNYIDACSIIKKEVFDEIGFYDTDMPYQGHEDWEFWLRMISSSFSFYYLNEITFDYRVSKGSMINQFNQNMISENISYIRRKHYKLYTDSYNKLYIKYLKLNEVLDKGVLIRILRRLKKIKLK